MNHDKINNIHDLFPNQSGGDEPPMDINARLSAIEATMPHLATKEDVANLRGDTIKWVVGVGIVSVITVLGVMLPLLIPIFTKIVGID